MIDQTQEALHAVADERRYQDRLVAADPGRGPKKLECYATYLRYYLNQLDEQVTTVWTRGAVAPVDALHTLRKIAALAVAGMEDNGILYRPPQDQRTYVDIDAVNNRHNQ